MAHDAAIALACGISMLLTSSGFAFVVHGEVGTGLLIVLFLLGLIVTLVGFMYSIVVLIRFWSNEES